MGYSGAIGVSRFSSPGRACAYLAGVDDELVSVWPILDRVDRFADLLMTIPDERAFRALREAEGSGRPLGNADFIVGLERLLGRIRGEKFLFS